MELVISVLCILIQTVFSSPHCIQDRPRTFHLIKRCQRSKQSAIELENVATLSECFKLAEHSRALALNYSPIRGITFNIFEDNQDSKTGFNFPRRSSRKHFLYQPEEFFNCHALQCPESSAFATMINDSRYDYYSLYGNPPEPSNLNCVPGVGIFRLNLTPEKYHIAFQRCNKTGYGALAHVASEIRTNALSKLLQGPDFTSGNLKLAHIGLNYTVAQSREFRTSEKDDLSCFLYRAWAPGHPRRDKQFLNYSCVAITTEVTWMSIDCERRLPYFCEIYTSPLNVSLDENACDMF